MSGMEVTAQCTLTGHVIVTMVMLTSPDGCC